MISDGDDSKPATVSRRWIAAALVPFAGVVVLRGLSRTEQFHDGPLSDWYVQAGLIAALLLGSAAVSWLVGRAYRGRE